MHYSLRLSPVLTGLVLGGMMFSSVLAQDPATTPAPAAATVENSVVKIFSTTRQPDPSKPWTKQAAREVSGTGVVIEGTRILTNAHVVLYASQIQVQPNQSGEKLTATVEFLARGIDLAVLKLEDETFFDTHLPLARADRLPQVKDSVLVYGYPTGGSSLSITKGIVSRIEFANYNYPVSGLRVQIDAAINSGNSGGPALAGDKVIGLAYSRLTAGDNIGYIIPGEEIDLFLKDIADGRYDGKPTMLDEFQPLTNPALRAYLKLDKTVSGVVLRDPESDEADYPLKPWDVITHIGEVRIDDEGMVNVSPTLRLRFKYLIQHQAREGAVALTVLRGGKPQVIHLPVPAEHPRLIANLEGSYPPYFIYGPIAFTRGSTLFTAPLTANAKYLTTFSGMGNPLATRLGDRPAFPDEELVVVSSPFFPHKLVKGYSTPFSRVLKSVNGTAVRNLAHLVELLRDSRDEFVIFEFAGRSAETVVLPRKDTIAATEEILTDNGVREQASPDMLKIWNTPPVQ